MIAGDIPDLPEYADPRSIKVHAPSLVVFICGGLIGDIRNKPISLRDAFMRISNQTPLEKYKLILAEEIEAFFPNGEYKELLKLEADIAQIAELLLLFSESAGSLAELGVFVMDDEVAPRLMVVIDDINYNAKSFIRLGPLYTLMLHHGEETVCVLTLSELNLKTIQSVEDVDLDRFKRALDEPLKSRLAKRTEPRTFDKNRHGHVTKLITGLIQYYSALTVEEIDVLLWLWDISVSHEEIRKHLMCAEIFGWVCTEKRGLKTYYAAIANKAAIHFELLEGAGTIDRKRWRADIADFWKKTDPQRFGVISKAAARSVK